MNYHWWIQKLLRAMPWLALMAMPCLVQAQPAMQDGLPPGIIQQDKGLIAVKDQMPMVRIAAGPLQMGSMNGAHDEKPLHSVILSAYLIDQHEVANAQFARFVAESHYQPQGPYMRGFTKGTEQMPVRFVTWHDAAAYARWAGRTLPTEAQWERAAKGPKSLTYPWGDAYQAGLARLGGAVADGPIAVGSLLQGASAEGCLDMAGNVWEWVADWYDRYGYAAVAANTLNPSGPADGTPPEERFRKNSTASGNERSTLKVIRGGAWSSRPDMARAAVRMWSSPEHWLNDTGFRCALPLEKKP